MKISHLFFASIIATTAWAGSNRTCAFFAKVEDTLVPLSGMSFAGFGDLMNVFSYSDPLARPTEFELTDDNHAFASNELSPGAVGLIKPIIVFGPTVNPTPLQLDKDNKLSNGQFYSCKMSPGSEVRRVLYEIRLPFHESCFEVEIYVLPYKKSPEASAVAESKSKKVVEKNGKTYSGQRREKWKDSYYKLPWVFFAKIGDQFMPLTGDAYPEIIPGVSAFSFRDASSDPAEFVFRDGFAISIDKSTVKNVGIYDSLFSVGSAVSPTKLKLDDEWRVLNSIFYSCVSSYGRSVISDTPSSTSCSKVDIYFLRYDEKTGSAVVNPLSPEEEKDNVSLKKVQKRHSVSITQDLSYMLFVKLGNSMIPLGARTYPYNGFNYSSMCYGRYVGDPIEFKMVGNAAISKSTSNKGYVGIYHRTLAFGRTLQPTNLMLDENSRLRNANYSSCWSFASFQIITSEKIFDDCFEVEVYLLPYGSEVANDAIDVPAPKENASEAKRKNKFKEAEESQDQTDESISPSVSGNLPYMFFAKLDVAMTPLSARVVPQYGKDFSVMYYEYEASKPTQFIKDGDYAVSLNTSTVGYFGIYKKIFVVGPHTPRTKLTLDDKSKVIDTDFYSCWDLNNNEVISVERMNENCYSVEIYFKQHDPNSGKPVSDVRSSGLEYEHDF